MKNLFINEQFVRKALPYLRDEYFLEKVDRIIYTEINDYTLKYNSPPTFEAIKISIAERDGIFEEEYKKCIELLSDLSKEKEESKLEWLLEETEKFCQEKALHNAILNSIHILDGKDKNKTKGSIPKLLTDALSVSFDPAIGHDYIEDWEKRFEIYNKKEKQVPFDLEYFNKITRGGTPNKTLNVILSGTGGGKSLFMCHHAASCLSRNLNVLYITLEMAQERIAERIDANLLNVKLDELSSLPKDLYEKKIAKLKSNIKGKLIIKEYPTSSAGYLQFKTLISELALKKNFFPDIIFIDYMNICCSSRLKHGANVNSYSYIKAIAEELRGLAVECDVPLFTATQTTRSGFSSSDPGLEDTSESFSVPATSDFMFALVSTEEMQNLNQVMVKQLKNRYSDPNVNKRFVLGIDRSKMRLYDAEQSAQKLADSGQDLEDKPLNRFGSSEKSRKFGFGNLKV